MAGKSGDFQDTFPLIESELQETGIGEEETKELRTKGSK
jgi:hypothetical protein